MKNTIPVSSGMIDGFLDSLRRKGRSPVTIQATRCQLIQLGQFLAEQGYSFLTADTQVLNQYYRRITELHTNQKTQYSKTHPVYSFYAWLTSEGFLLLNPAPQPLKQKGNSIPRSLPNSDLVRSAYEKLSLFTNHFDQRDAVILDLAYSCGLRREELQRLTVSDIDSVAGTVRVKGKGGHERLVPVGTQTRRNIHNYLFHVRPWFVGEYNSKDLFLGIKHKRGLAKGTISVTFKRFRKRFHLPPNLTPHALRHAFATDLIRNGATLQDVSKMLGHVDLKTTQIYTQIASVDLKKVHQSCHPRG